MSPTPRSLTDVAFINRAARRGLRPDYCTQCHGVLVRDVSAVDLVYRCSGCGREGRCAEGP